MHHAYVIEAGVEEGIARAEQFIAAELKMRLRGNPDLVTLRYGLLTAEDARRVGEIAAQAPLAGEHKAIIVAASRAYHEAQNALLKLFEEPPRGTYLFLILPTLGSLLPTLRSRVQVLEAGSSDKGQGVRVGGAEEFLKMSGEKRSALIKKLATGKDEEERREHRDEAIALVDGLEAAAYRQWQADPKPALAALMSDIETLRKYLYDRSASVKMILEHLAIVIPKGLR